MERDSRTPGESSRTDSLTINRMQCVARSIRLLATPLLACKLSYSYIFLITSFTLVTLLQKNRGPAGNIPHFFSRFFGFWGLFALQTVAMQQQAAIKPLPKKSCSKTYRRFFVFSNVCQNQPVRVEQQARRLDRMNRIYRINPCGSRLFPILSILFILSKFCRSQTPTQITLGNSYVTQR